MKILLLILVIAVIVGLAMLARRGPRRAAGPHPSDVHPTSTPEATPPPGPAGAADPDGPGLPEDGEPGTPPWDGLR